MLLINQLGNDGDLSKDQQASLNVYKQGDENHEVLEFMRRGKKNSRIPHKHKIRLVLDAKKTSFQSLEYELSILLGIQWSDPY